MPSSESTEESRKKTQLHIIPSSDEIGTSSNSIMTGMQNLTEPIEECGNEPESRSRSKVIFNVPSTPQRRLATKQDDTEDITSVIVNRVCEGSVASDVSGLTDGEFFKTDDYSAPSATSYQKNKNFRSLFRAPEPPKESPSSKLTDIQSETTATTISSSRDEKMAKNKKKRSVSFSEVQVRNYERVVEINPSVTHGPAIGIGWNYSPDEDEIVSLELFEESREYSRHSSTDELALSRDEREDLLRDWGYTQRDIARSVRTILRSKNQRKQTIQNLHASHMEEAVEKATRKMKSALLSPLSAIKRGKKHKTASTNKKFDSAMKTSLVRRSAA